MPSKLRYFIVVAELQHMTRAAEVLNISQPYLSKTIADLEHEIGVQLFDRIGKKITINDRGEVLYRSLINSFREMQDTMTMLTEMSSSTTGKLNLGIFITSSFMLPCIKEYMRLNPMVETAIYSYSDLFHQNQSDFFDAIIYPQSIFFAKYKGSFLAQDRYLAVLPRNHPLSDRPSLNLKELQDDSMVFISHGSNRYESIYGSCQRAGFTPHTLLSTDSESVHRDILELGLAVGFITSSQRESCSECQSIRLVEIEDKDASLNIMIGFKRLSRSSLAAKAFFHHAREFFKLDITE